eukprot:CAMPEP_0173448034 /NCGR_PEP_ID=MMETSP1357-20121228/39955_1 /TAXON_ID=77926 /ORGANISM="Hemiselmis rufescens, Strain PCC563" /LENGTH=61 /DNA_ID=CAMNT_0014414491 /DNA_START=56 /DNA_END=237 /DNA_ORIENTATION=-
MSVRLAPGNHRGYPSAALTTALLAASHFPPNVGPFPPDLASLREAQSAYLQAAAHTPLFLP